MILNQDFILVVDLEEEGVSSIVLRAKKPSSVEFLEVEVTLTEAQFGFYNVTIPGAFISEYGKYIFLIEKLDAPFLFIEEDCDPSPLHAPVPPNTCIIMGNIRNASSAVEAFAQVKIEARPLRIPFTSNGTFILGQSVITYSDYSGFFQLPLIRGMTALIEIKDVGVRFQAVIPDAETVRIEDIIPQ